MDLQGAEVTSGAAAPDVPQIPRPLTPVARRRSWGEMPTRLWTVLAIVVGFVTIYFTATRLHEAFLDRWLIQNGIKVDAKFTRVNSDFTPKRWMRNETMPAEIDFEVNGKAHKASFSLVPKSNAAAQVGTIFPIRVDPNNPARWIEETLPKSWVQELAGLGFLVPIFALVLAVLAVKRWRVLRTWKNEPILQADVVDVLQTPIAPMSRVIRFSLHDGADRRIFSTLMPVRAGIPSRGESIWVICPPTNPGRAIVAKLYC